jgi:hypothetical protein
MSTERPESRYTPILIQVHLYIYGFSCSSHALEESACRHYARKRFECTVLIRQLIACFVQYSVSVCSCPTSSASCLTRLPALTANESCPMNTTRRAPAERSPSGVQITSKATVLCTGQQVTVLTMMPWTGPTTRGLRWEPPLLYRTASRRTMRF